mmetsp:Transcript_14593/g.24306  ORF Transcript_14593/g.24306 Transcript_14593/m.24306 type:complete len:206 (-) Transcript_14593:580-1197(-)
MHRELLHLRHAAVGHATIGHHPLWRHHARLLLSSSESTHIDSTMRRHRSRHSTHATTVFEHEHTVAESAKIAVSAGDGILHIAFLLRRRCALLELLETVVGLLEGLHEEGNDIVSVAVDPPKLEGEVGTDVREAGVQSGAEALLLRRVAEETQDVLNNFSIGRLVRGIDAVLPHTIALGKLDGLAPLLVATVHIGRDATELEKLV